MPDKFISIEAHAVRASRHSQDSTKARAAAKAYHTALRDQFAMAALTGIYGGQTDHRTHYERADAAYAAADAMLKRRAVEMEK
jgi:hypothetical protein